MKPNDLPLAVRGALAAMTYDHAFPNMMTFDGMSPVVDHSPTWGAWNQSGYPVNPGMPLGYGAHGARGGIRYTTHDGQSVTVDSTGAFLVGELERLDMEMHEPLAQVSYGRDVDLREDVTIADEVSSFTLTTFASAGSLGTGNGIGNGKAWIGKTTDQIAGVSVDISKVPHVLTPWAIELKYDILELESAAKVGRPVDAQKYSAMLLKNQMDIDEMVYYGDTPLAATGLVNDAGVTPVGVAAGVAGFTQWDQKTPDEILTDINNALNTVWVASAFAVIPGRILLPTKAYGYIATQKVSLAGNQSILSYVEQNNLFSREGKGNLGIFPAKWCNGAGAGGVIGTGAAGKDRMVVYTKDKKYVRYPMTLLQRTPIQFDGLYHKSTYFCRLGQLEIVYPETFGYFDGIS